MADKIYIDEKFAAPLVRMIEALVLENLVDMNAAYARSDSGQVRFSIPVVVSPGSKDGVLDVRVSLKFVKEKVHQEASFEFVINQAELPFAGPALPGGVTAVYTMKKGGGSVAAQ